MVRRDGMRRRSLGVFFERSEKRAYGEAAASEASEFGRLPVLLAPGVPQSDTPRLDLRDDGAFGSTRAVNGRGAGRPAGGWEEGFAYGSGELGDGTRDG